MIGQRERQEPESTPRPGGLGAAADGPVSGPTNLRRRPRNEGIRSILSTVAVLLLAPIIALILTAFVFQSYQVAGPSMEPVLNPNDRLLVWKVPKTWSRITGNSYIPKRGDVVVFVEPSMATYEGAPNKQLIKRVIGLPGERVVVKDGRMAVYNAEHPDGFEPDKTLPYGTDIIGDVGGDVDVVVPEKEIFVVGDNRGNSMDSRSFGTVEAKNIVGKLILRILPLGDMKRF